jgi:hypothetical protein
MEAHEALRRQEHVLASDGGLNRLAQHAALTVAVLAAFLALSTFMANEAVKEVITGETRAADTTARFEAIDTKATIADANAVVLRALGSGSTNTVQVQAIAKATALEERITEELAPEARELRAEIRADHAERDHAEDQHLIYELSVVVLQIGIVLAGIAILAKRRWLLGAGQLAGAAGVALVAVGALA